MDDVNTSLQASHSGMQAMEEKYEVTSEKIEQLEREVVEAKNIADVSVRRAEEVVRKLVLAEHNKDRTEEKAAVCEEKIRRLQVGQGDG